MNTKFLENSMDSTLLNNVFRAITLSRPAPREMLIKEKDPAFRHLLAATESINKAKIYILKEIADQVLSNMYWKDVNVIEIDPKDMTHSTILLNNLIGHVDPLVFVILSTDDKHIAAAKTYFQQHIKNPLIITGCTLNVYTDNLSGYINELRNSYHPQNLFFVSAHKQHEMLLLKKISSIASHRDYLLVLVPTYAKSLEEKLTRKIQRILGDTAFPAAWKNLLINSDDGAWKCEYKDSCFEVNFKLKRKIQLQCKSDFFSVPRYGTICLIRLYLPREKYLYSYIAESGYTIIYTCKEKHSSISILLCQKSGKMIPPPDAPRSALDE